MPRWTKDDLAAFNARRKASSAEPEPPVRDEPLATAPGTSNDRRRFSVRITSYRNKLCDPDNLCGKFFVDCLRYASIIPDDTAAIIDYSIRQEKVWCKEDERTIIEVGLL